MKKAWWKESIIYQIYPRSFKDFNGDGIGDLEGIIDKIPYLQSLGVDIIWLSPIYQSPNDDNGYDISDYYAIMQEFGSLSHFDRMLETIHAHGMKLMMDLVVNHTSDEHAWFQQSRQSQDSPFRDYYIWRTANGAAAPPNNWRSFFTGSAWEYDSPTQSWYLHLFSKKQPDLNWENDQLRSDVYEMMHYWLKKGIDGFRMDVIPLISKPEGLPDKNWEELKSDFGTAYANGPRVHEFLQEMHREVLSHYDIVTVGEAPGITVEQANLYVGEDRNELNMIFHFDHMFMDHGPGGRMDPLPWDLPRFTSVFDDWEKGLGEKGWGSLYLGNHDFPRMVSRFGNADQYWMESAKLLATLLFTRKGTPGIYQGDEIGMTNTPFSRIEEYRDIEILNAYRELVAKGEDVEAFLEAGRTHARDHARTPMQWDATLNAGFSTQSPWIMVNPNYTQINVAAQEDDPNSILNYYRKMIRLRKADLTWVYGETEVIDTGHTQVYAYTRAMDQSKYLVLLNFSDEEAAISTPEDSLKIISSNYPDLGERLMLRPWEARIIEY